jgi:hypothetical protein
VDAATRDRLGDLFCGWYRNPHDDSEINFAAGDDWNDAIPVRVRDVADEGWQAWLATAGRQDDGTMIWERISATVERFRECDCAVLVAPAWNIDGRELIHDGTHRACAIYLLDPPRVELDLLPLGPLPPHRANEARAIRAA